VKKRLKVFAQYQAAPPNLRCAKLPGSHELVNRAAGNSRRDARLVYAKCELVFRMNFREFVWHVSYLGFGSPHLIFEVRACLSQQIGHELL
jgi:hypothetical protein